LVISSKEHYKHAKKEYGTIFPEPVEIPEVPIKETNPLRPMSPYAVSKVYGDHLMQELLPLIWIRYCSIKGF
jgi:GDPmannose 4,6-dehydratase